MKKIGKCTNISRLNSENQRIYQLTNSKNMKNLVTLGKIIPFQLKYDLKMKLTTFLSMLALFQTQANTIYSQKTEITLNYENVSLEKALDKIEALTKYKFIYNDKEVQYKKLVSIRAKKESVSNILDRLFLDINIVFEVLNKQIILRSKPITNSDIPDKSIHTIQMQLQISGSITDDKGQPLPGANIIVKGTTNGTRTDFNGHYSLVVSKFPLTLVFSYIGFVSKELVLTGQSTTVDIIMTEDVSQLSEVVITALGIKRKEKALSYNVQKVSGNELLKNKDANFINALSGKVAGVNINSSSSGIGGSSKVVMRGTKGIAQSSNALYVIDGIPMFNIGGEGSKEFGSRGYTEAIADINPEDIESISVLTGAAAAALYGSEAANGAIVINTKKGKAGTSSLTLTNNTELIKAFALPNFQNTYGTGDLSSDIISFDKSWGRKLNSFNYTGYSPKRDFIKTGISTTKSIALSTGNDKNQTYVSAGIIDSKGAIPNKGYNRFNFTFRNTTSFFNDKIKLNIGGSFIKQKDINMTNQGVYSNSLVTAYLFPRGDYWDNVKLYERFDPTRKINIQHWPQAIDEYVGQNPYWIAYRNIRENKKNRYLLTIGLNYDINEWLSITSRTKIDNTENTFERMLYASSNKTLTEGSDNGFYGVEELNGNQTYADVLVNYNNTFNNIHSLQANIGAIYSDFWKNIFSNEGAIRSDGIPNLFNVFQLDDDITKRSQSGYHDQTQSVLASFEYGYKGSYYLTLTGRNDWPSQLAGASSTKSSFFYPSIGVSFILSQIFNLPKQIEYAKLRSSYASVGLPFQRFLANPTYTWDNSNKVWQTKTHYPISNLLPERTNSFEIGLSAKFFTNFNLNVSYYSTETFNQTFDPKISVSSGYSTLYVQTGNVKNSGVELSMGFNKKWEDLIWDSGFTFSFNKNEILELVENYTHPVTKAIINKDRLDIGGLSNARFILKKGGSLGDLYSIADLNRDSNDNIYVNPNGEITANYNIDDIKLGSVFPKVNMAFRNGITYKNFNVGFLISARLGGIVYSATQAILDRYGVSKASADARNNGGIVINGGDIIDAQKWYTVIGGQSGIPQFYTYSATNVRLQEASIGYTIPKEKLYSLADVSFSVVGRNVLMIYNKAPYDPESVASTGNYYQGIDYFMMPSLKSLGFNIRIEF